jgi:threonine synthase
MEKTWKKYGVLLDPHGAVAMAAAERRLESPNFKGHIVVMATGHPAKFAKLVKKHTGQDISVPERFGLLEKELRAAAHLAPNIDALETAVAALV